MDEILTLDYSKNGTNKRIHVMEGSVTNITEQVDLLVCSVFKGGYSATPGTLIGALYHDKGISLNELYKRPAIDLRDRGCWLSKETDTNFSRIACMELLSWEKRHNIDESVNTLLTSTFSTLSYLCEQAIASGIPLRKIVLPILGAGYQNIDISYVAPIMLSQMSKMLGSIDQLTDVYIVEKIPGKVMQLSNILSKLYENNSEASPEVFISYSAKRPELAYQILETLTNVGVVCWMAPESIAPGSSYIEGISEGLGNTKLTVLVLTEDAEKSRWVQKEIGTTIGAGHILIPYQPEPFEIGQTFRFLLDGEQILEAWKHDIDPMTVLKDHVIKKLALYSE